MELLFCHVPQNSGDIHVTCHDTRCSTRESNYKLAYAIDVLTAAPMRSANSVLCTSRTLMMSVSCTYLLVFVRDAVCSVSRRKKVCNYFYFPIHLSVIHSVQETCICVWIHSFIQYSSSVEGEVSVTAVILRPIISQVQNPFTVYISGWVSHKSAAHFVTSWKKLCSGQEQ
jgi:hypothetical protein